jgi:hypothetical protein
MAKAMKTNAADYSNQFKPALHLGAMTLAQLGEMAYAVPFQDRIDPTGEHFLRLGRGLSTDPGLAGVIQLITPVPGFTPLARTVEVTGKKDYTAICIEGGMNQLGVFLYMMRSADAGGGARVVHINTRFLPFAMLSDLVVGTTKDGLLELRLPDADIAKLNVTLRITPLQEPEYRTFKTELIFENLPTAQQQEIESRLNFQAASVAAFLGFQLLASQGQLDAAQGVGAADVGINGSTKFAILAAIVTLGVILAGTAAILRSASADSVVTNSIGLSAAGVAGAASLYGAWDKYWAERKKEQEALQAAQNNV